MNRGGKPEHGNPSNVRASTRNKDTPANRNDSVGFQHAVVSPPSLVGAAHPLKTRIQTDMHADDETKAEVDVEASGSDSRPSRNA